MAQLSFRENLEQFNNPDEVRRRLAAGQYAQPQAGIAQEYLDSIDRKEAASATAARAAREVEALTIARDSASSARDSASSARLSATSAFEAARWAKWAAIIAAIAIVIATKDQILTLIFGAP